MRALVAPPLRHVSKDGEELPLGARVNGSLRLFLLPGISSLATTKYLCTQAGTRHVAILRGRFGSWPELVLAGRVLMQLWLSMTRHGVYMLPFGSMITNSTCNRYLRERFAADDIWFILRFGYSAVPPQAPRLASVLCGDDRPWPQGIARTTPPSAAMAGSSTADFR